MKKISLILVAFITFAAIAVFMRTAVYSFFTPNVDITLPSNEPEPIPSHAAWPGEYPSRLIIPALEINAAVQRVGISAKGNMASPTNFMDVGWFRLGAKPGELGSAVMAGHFDNAIGLAGVFKRLDQIKTGDEVLVKTEKGAELRFVVTAIETYPYKAVPADTLFNRRDGVRLNLVTCVGEWVQKDKTYDHRLVVYTELR